MSMNTGIGVGSYPQNMPLITNTTRGIKSFLGKTSDKRLNDNKVNISKGYFEPMTIKELQKQLTQDGVPLPSAIGWKNLLEGNRKPSFNLFDTEKVKDKKRIEELAENIASHTSTRPIEIPSNHKPILTQLIKDVDIVETSPPITRSKTRKPRSTKNNEPPISRHAQTDGSGF